MPRLASITSQSLTGLGKLQEFFYPLSNSATDPTDSGAAIRSTPGYTFVANEGIYTTAPITNLNGAFVFTSFNDPDINLWDVSTVTTLANAFAFNSTFNQPLNNWDVGNVESMNQMFYQASSFDQDISSWDTSSCTDMRRALDTGSVYSYDLSSWNVNLITTYPDPQFADPANFPLNRQPRFGVWLDDNANQVTVNNIVSGLAMQVNGVFAQNPSVPFGIRGEISNSTATVSNIAANTGTLLELDVDTTTGFQVSEGLRIT